ncbi:MAG: protein translocase subunit SecD [Planctomycetota bacterium]|nr:MAG: protein translocase subunit SecD [Planctomycetota bacterium]
MLHEQASAPAETQPTSDETPLRIRVRDAAEAYADAVDAVMETNLPPQRFQYVRDLARDSDQRAEAVALLKKEYPALAQKIDAALAAYDRWRGKAVYLEGPADLRRLLRGAGVLEFRILAEADPQNAARYARYREQLQTRGTLPEPGATMAWFKIDNPMNFFNLRSVSELQSLTPEMIERTRGMIADQRDGEWYILAKTRPEDGLLHDRTGQGPQWKLKSARIDRDDQGRRCVSFLLDPVGGRLFRDLTSKNINKQLCIFIDDVAYSSANILTAIGAAGQITGDFSAEKLNYLVQTMQAGVLPARLKDTPLSERTIGSSLGEQNLRSALYAGIAGIIAVAAGMIIYYGVSGAIADVALLMNVLLVLAAMAMLDARMTLAGIAGVILTIGMTVDANVLIFERMREEKERGASLRMIIKNGYDKAFSTIIDANITTLLICVIIYKIGSEEIKGFGLTLGWGIVTSLFTALFVTRTIFLLLAKYKLIKSIGMLKLIGVPKVDWYGKRKFFIPLSALLMIIGLGLLIDRGRDTLDVEFLGGINAEVELVKNPGREYTDPVIRDRLSEVGQRIAEDGRKLAEATVEPLPDRERAFRIRVGDLPATRIEALLAEALRDQEMIVRDGLSIAPDGQGVIAIVEEGVDRERLTQAVHALGSDDGIPKVGREITHANVSVIIESDDPADRNRFWSITTTATNKQLVQYALVQAFGGDLVIQPRVAYVFRGGPDGRPFPITARRLDRSVIPVLPEQFSVEATDFVGGAAMVFDDLDPPQTTAALQQRLEAMRLQPDFQDLVPYRRVQVFGVRPTGQSRDGEPLYSSVLVAVVDDQLRYEDSEETWRAEVADKELLLASAALDQEQALRSVTQFKPQIAAQAQTRAIIALVLSWAMIIAYLWIRFGRPMYGVAGVAALVHDVLIALAFVGISGWIGGIEHPIGNALLIHDFKIDMTIVAAFLTIIGYSINDTIVVFDRIRETRGRLGRVTPEIINTSINQTLARTLLTSATTLLVLLTMYIFGGESIRGFNYCMIIGVLTGTYSSIAVASPLLMIRATEGKPAARSRLATAS